MKRSIPHFLLVSAFLNTLAPACCAWQVAPPKQNLEISDTLGLDVELALRPSRGLKPLAPNRLLMIGEDGLLRTVEGEPTTCVTADGHTVPCLIGSDGDVTARTSAQGVATGPAQSSALSGGKKAAALKPDTSTGRGPQGQAVSRPGASASAQLSSTAPIVACTDTGTVNSILCTVPNVTAYARGMTVYAIPAAGNTGAVTINVNGLGSVAVTKNGSAALSGGELLTGAVAQLQYDGTRFQVLNGLPGSIDNGSVLTTLPGRTVKVGTTVLDPTLGITAPNLINVASFSGADAGQKVAAALAASPSGSVLDGRMLVSGWFTTVAITKNFTLLAGPYTYTCVGSCFTQGAGTSALRFFLFGAGQTTTTFKGDGSHAVFDLTDASVMELANFVVNANGYTGASVYLHSNVPGTTTSSRNLIQRVGFSGGGAGAIGLWMATVDTTTIRECIFTGPASGASVGIRIDNGNSVSNDVSDTTIQSWARGISNAEIGSSEGQFRLTNVTFGLNSDADVKILAKSANVSVNGAFTEGSGRFLDTVAGGSSVVSSIEIKDLYVNAVTDVSGYVISYGGYGPIIIENANLSRTGQKYKFDSGASNGTAIIIGSHSVDADPYVLGTYNSVTEHTVVSGTNVIHGLHVLGSGSAPVFMDKWCVDLVNHRFGIGFTFPTCNPSTSFQIISGEIMMTSNNALRWLGGLQIMDNGSGNASITGGAILSGLVDVSAKGIKLPTSCSGLAAGTLYNNAGTPAICP